MCKGGTGPRVRHLPCREVSVKDIGAPGASLPRASAIAAHTTGICHERSQGSAVAGSGARARRSFPIWAHETGTLGGETLLTFDS
jgi:hypothetical protein